MMNTHFHTSEDIPLVISTSGAKAQDGLCLARFNTKSGALSDVSSTQLLENSMFLALAPGGKFLYATNNNLVVDEDKKGGLSAFAVADNDTLKPINTVPMPDVPCHISIDRSGKWIFTASYSGAYISVCPLREDGSIGPIAAKVQHEGKNEETGINERRQSAPHPHMIVSSLDNRYVFVADLGLDKVLVYDFDADSGALSPATSPFAKLAPGAGPRHLVQHPQNHYLYVVNELDNTVTAFAEKNGNYESKQVLSTLPDGFAGDSFTAEIGLSPDARFLFASNRGQNTLAVYAVNDDGSLGAPTFTQTGEWPQHFTFDPSGEWLLSADMNGHAISIFRYDAKSGSLTSHKSIKDLPGKPMCLAFVD